MIPDSVSVILSKAKNPSLFFNSILKWQFENTTILSYFHFFHCFPRFSAWTSLPPSRFGKGSRFPRPRARLHRPKIGQGRQNTAASSRLTPGPAASARASRRPPGSSARMLAPKVRSSRACAGISSSQRAARCPHSCRAAASRKDRHSAHRPNSQKHPGSSKKPGLILICKTHHPHRICAGETHNAECKMQNEREFHVLHSALCILHYNCNRVCKPGSVLDSHLSCRTVAGTLYATSTETAGPANVSSTVLLRIEFTASDSLQPTGELLPHLSTLAPLARGGISLLHFS